MNVDATWLIEESGFDRARANYFETVFTVGNGGLGTRGSLEEKHDLPLSSLRGAGGTARSRPQPLRDGNRVLIPGRSKI